MRRLALMVVLAGCGKDELFVDAGPGIDSEAVDAQAPAPDAGPNRAPVASAGADRRAMVDNRITLAGSGTDEDADTLTYAWTQTAGPTVTLDDAASPTPSFRLRAAGTYTFSLVVSDGEASSAADTADLRVHDLNGGEDFSLSLEPDGELWAWGRGLDGELGNGLNTGSGTPVRVCDAGATDCTADPFTGAIAISTGRAQAFALDTSGTVWSWGFGFAGELGDGLFDTRNTPGPVCRDDAATDCAAEPLTGVIAIASGYQHAVALKADGTVWAWGFNGDGELGNGSEGGTFAYPAPVCAVGATPPCTAANANILDDIVMISAGGGGHTLALSSTGALYAFGHNKSGQCGIGDNNFRVVSTPMQVCAPGQTAPCSTYLTGVVDFDAWSGHSLALDANGALWGWGGNDEGELGQITSIQCPSATTCSPSPGPVCASYDLPCSTPLAGVTAFAAGRRYSSALLADGTMRAWGSNFFGQVGNGGVQPVLSPALSPTRVCAPGETAPCGAFLDHVAAVSAGSFHTLAIGDAGAIYAWGDNDFGQLGDGSADPFHATPGPVAAH